jgi:two-component sensor histidine kinase
MQRMSEFRMPRTLRRDLLDMLWQQPLWAIPFAIFFGAMYAITWAGLARTYAMALIFAFSIRLCLIVVRHFIVPRMDCEEGPRDLRRMRSWREGLAFATGAMVGSYLAAIIIHFTIWPAFLGTPRAFVVSSLFALVFTVLFSGISYAIVFYRQAVERAAAVEQARAELARAELRALRAQINPHFLFNTLNTIAALIAENPGAAEETVTRLAEVFRYALQASEREHARLGEELRFLRATLDIERMRFGERLRVEEAIEPGLDAALVPSLLLQPLIENAVRHGVGPQAEGGTVRLEARRDNGQLVLEVADDGAGMNGDAPRGTGFGLHSVRERMRAAGPPHAIAIDSAPGAGTRVRLTLPLRFDQPGGAS